MTSSSLFLLQINTVLPFTVIADRDDLRIIFGMERIGPISIRPPATLWIALGYSRLAGIVGMQHEAEAQ